MKCVITHIKTGNESFLHCFCCYVVALNRSIVAYSLPGELVHYACLHIVEFSVDAIQFCLYIFFCFCDSFLFNSLVYFVSLIFIVTTGCEPLLYRITSYFCHTRKNTSSHFTYPLMYLVLCEIALV